MHTTNEQWMVAQDAWNVFVKRHPELGYREGRWPFHNFLRFYRRHLVELDAIRLARRRHWVANLPVFLNVAFDCATGLFDTDQAGNALPSGSSVLPFRHQP